MVYGLPRCDHGKGPFHASRARSETESQSDPKTNAESGPASPFPSSEPAAGWRSDESFQPLVDAYQQSGARPGGITLTDGDWSDAHSIWRKLDAEDLPAAVEGVRRKLAARTDPQFYSKPKRYLDRREWMAIPAARAPTARATGPAVILGGLGEKVSKTR